MRVKLDSVDAWRPKVRLDILGLPVVIGRNGDCDIRLDDRWISRRHCELRISHGELVVRDLESRYGTLVNGQHIQQASLQPGDELTIGIRTLRVSYQVEETEEVPGGVVELQGHRPLVS